MKGTTSLASIVFLFLMIVHLILMPRTVAVWKADHAAATFGPSDCLGK